MLRLYFCAVSALEECSRIYLLCQSERKKEKFRLEMSFLTLWAVCSHFSSALTVFFAPVLLFNLSNSYFLLDIYPSVFLESFHFPRLNNSGLCHLYRIGSPSS